MKKFEINHIVLCSVRVTSVINAESREEVLIKLATNCELDFDDKDNYEIINDEEIIKTIIKEIKS